jgi:hypothetical protein
VTLRILLVSDRDSIGALSAAAADAGVETKPHELAPGPHNFGLLEIGAIIVLAKQAVELADLIMTVWKKRQNAGKITITTPKGSVTVDGNSSKTVEDIVEQLKPVLA